MRVQLRPAKGALVRVKLPMKREAMLVVELVRLPMRSVFADPVGMITGVVAWVEKEWE